MKYQTEPLSLSLQRKGILLYTLKKIILAKIDKIPLFQIAKLSYKKITKSTKFVIHKPTVNPPSSKPFSSKHSCFLYSLPKASTNAGGVE